MAFLAAKVSSLAVMSWAFVALFFSHHLRLMMKMLATVLVSTGFGLDVVNSTV